ncbi:polysaccharide deacetylase family protein [Streptomyces sp. NPDC007088]|uniref:polysaccharide deacetylase family protein n=1 Tax=Streptomyces sp. NPDC007088 TaxID=3364773 RepID=UPI0036B62F6C
MPESVRGPHRSSRRRRGAAALALATAFGAVLSGCTSLHTVAPKSERAHANAKVVMAHQPVDCREAKCIALTFDAGPSRHTPQLLKILKEKKVHATFFLLGKNHIERYPKLVKRISDEGHEVAQHTWSHRRLTDLSDTEVRREMSRTQKAVKDLTGKEPTLMRPPQGRTSDEVSKICEEFGIAQVLWSATAKDYSTNDSKLIEKRILDQSSRDGIILLHDLYQGTVPAVPGIIDALRKRGYTFVTVPQLMAPGVPKPGAVYRP